MTKFRKSEYSLLRVKNIALVEHQWLQDPHLSYELAHVFTQNFGQHGIPTLEVLRLLTSPLDSFYPNSNSESLASNGDKVFTHKSRP